MWLFPKVFFNSGKQAQTFFLSLFPGVQLFGSFSKTLGKKLNVPNVLIPWWSKKLHQKWACFQYVLVSHGSNCRFEALLHVLISRLSLFSWTFPEHDWQSHEKGTHSSSKYNHVYFIYIHQYISVFSICTFCDVWKTLVWFGKPGTGGYAQPKKHPAPEDDPIMGHIEEDAQE